MLEETLKNYGIDNYIMYGKDMAKVYNKKDKKGKLILVTSINPTPYGEGKTTISIGLNDAFKLLGKKSIVVLREPSLGPVFGSKGGATGGGLSSIEPSDKINLHFTGDMHAITTANNMIAAAIDNSIYFDNPLDIDLGNIYFNRCIDINDRALRNVELSVGNIKRCEHFEITAASELMAIFCLSKDIDDLKFRIGNICFGLNKKGEMLYVKDLKIENAIVSLLKDAFLPNAVLTKEGSLAFVHGGPFANVAQGTSSLTSIETALSYSDYVITEAGFGSDLGGIKFFDIMGRSGLEPSLVCINVTIRALKYHGLGSLEEGFSNLEFHINNMKKFSKNVLVVLNRFADDEQKDIDYLKSKLDDLSISTSYIEGGIGSFDFALKVISKVEDNKINYLYDLNDTLDSKIDIMLKNLGSNNIQYTDVALKKLEKYRHINYPICIAKTPMSISDDKKKLGYPKDFSVLVNDIKLCNGAGFIVIYLGNILTMPGLTKDAKIYQ